MRREEVWRRGGSKSGRIGGQRIIFEVIWTALAWSKHTFEGKLYEFAVFRFRFFRLSARVGKIHEKHSFYRSDFPEWRSRLHNNTIRVVPGCFLVPFWGAFGTPLGALGLPLAPLWLAFGPPWYLWELWMRTWVLNLMVLATPTCSWVLF